MHSIVAREPLEVVAIEFPSGFTQTKEDALMLKSSRSYTRSTLSTNLAQRHIIPWETGNAKDIIGRCPDCYAH